MIGVELFAVYSKCPRCAKKWRASIILESLNFFPEYMDHLWSTSTPSDNVGHTCTSRPLIVYICQGDVRPPCNKYGTHYLPNQHYLALIHSFPHASQFLSSCWSYFMLERQKYGIPSCGFFFNMVEKRL